MARIKAGSLGTPSGKVGNTVYRRKNKKTMAYRLNEVYNKSFSDAALKNESIFTQVTKFSNFVNKPDIVKKVWMFSKMPGAYSNLKIYKYNYKSIRNWGISSDFHILSENFYYQNKNITLNKNNLTLEFSVLPALILFKKQTKDFDPPYTFLSLIHAKDPVNPKTKPDKLSIFLIEKPDSFEISNEGTSCFTFVTDENSFSFIDDFNTVIVFPAIVSVDSNGKIYKWAENGGFYIKGNKPSDSLHKPKTPPVSPNRTFLIDY